MLFTKILSFGLLALQAGFCGAKPVTGHERREAAITDADAKLLPRADILTESGTKTGKAEDTVYTHGLATCAGLAASGNAGSSGINKVLVHVRCVPPTGETFQDQADEWARTVIQSGMTDIKVVVDILNPDIAPPPARPAQVMVNNAAIGAAQSVGAGYMTHHRQSMADPAPAGELRINLDGTISIGGTVVA